MVYMGTACFLKGQSNVAVCFLIYLFTPYLVACVDCTNVRSASRTWPF